MTRQDRDAGADRNGAGPAALFDFSRALVIGRSHVTCVVVSRIVERSGLKAVLAPPEGAAALLDASPPALIVLDGGADNRECDALAGPIAVLRGLSGRAAPAVVLLSNRNLRVPITPSGPWPDGVIDAVVAKPITPEQLQPVVDRLLAEAQG